MTTSGMAEEYHAARMRRARKAERDEWAKLSLPYIIKVNPGYTIAAIAKLTYAMADAMIAEGNRLPRVECEHLSSDV